MPQANIRRYLKHGTLPQLRLFEASARLGCFTRAAEELHMAQPTASVQIKKLTETVGLPLFEQVGKRIYLTDAGTQVYAGCHDVFRALSTLEDTLSAMRGLESGHFRLAVTTTAKNFAPRLLAAFAQRYPGIKTSLQIHNRGTLMERLANNEDDLYMFMCPPEGSEVVTQSILPNPLVVFARHDHPLASVKNITFERLAAEPFLMREEGSGMRMVTLKLFERHGLTPKIRMELSTSDSIREAILAGLGVSILPRYTLALEPEHTAVVCLDVEGFPLESHWYLVYPVGKRLPLPAQAFMEMTREYAKRLMREHLATG